MKHHKSSAPSPTLGLAIFLLLAAMSGASEPEAEIAASALVRFPQTKSQPEELKPNIIYSRQLNGQEKHFFTVRAENGKCLRFVIEQKGIDVMITVKNAEVFLKQVDRPSGGFGRETVTFTAPQTGVYQIEIQAWTREALAAGYEINYALADSPTADDRLRDAAENLTSEAERLRAEGTKSSREKALQKFAEALTIWRELNDFFEQAVVYYGIGYTNYQLSNFYEAARNYNRALDLHLQIGDEFGQALNCVGLGTVQYSFNEYELAVYNIQKAIETYKKIGNARGLGIAYHALGTARFLAEDYDGAILDLTESLRWRMLARHNSGKKLTHISLAKIYLYLRLNDKAEQQLLEAKNLTGEKAFLEDAELQYYFGRFYLATGKLNEARKALEPSLILYRQTGNKNGEALALLELSRVSAQTGQPEKALGEIRAALNLVEQARQSVLESGLRINFFASVLPFYEHYVSLLMRMHERKPHQGFDRQALEISEQSRARGLLDRLARRELIKQGRIAPARLERERQLRGELTDLLTRLKNGTSTGAALEIQKISSQLIEAEAEIEQVFSSQETTRPLTLTVEKIQAQMDAGTVLLEYGLVKNESFLWLVSRDKFKSFRLAAPTKIEREAKAVYDCLSKPAPGAGENLCRQKLNALSASLLRPIAADIQNKRLLVVKQGFLQYIPFAALFSPTTNDYLIKSNEIVTLPSASVLSFIRQAKSSDAPLKTLAIFGDPVYSPDDGRLGKFGGTPAATPVFNANLPRLFAASFEVERIASLVPSEKLLVKTGAEANRQNVLESDLKNYRILHFAAHALTDDRRPEISAVALSLFGADGKYVDGFLRANDILRLDLNADLIVLSMCRSGVGKQIKGEGTVSLANSFFASGARRMLASLWNVEDKVTAEFMARFYDKHLKRGKSFSAALRETQIEMMRDRRWRAPFYWSAFVLHGSYTKLP